jgi:hypothetical protein
MKLVSKYLADALKFERLAAEEKDEQLKLSFLQQGSGLSQVGREEGEGARQAFGSIEPLGPVLVPVDCR